MVSQFTPFEMLWWLVVAHFLCDYAIQNDFQARGKNHRKPLPGVPWGWCLAAHSITHGAAVLLITGSSIACGLEIFFHALLDFLKCESDGSNADFHKDQFLHLFLKVLFVWAVWMEGGTV